MTFSTAQMVLTPIGYLTGMVIPYFFESYGITQNYDILFDPMVRDNVFRILCILAIIGAFLQFAPLVFYDLTQTKHQNIIRVLKVRAMFEDYSNGVMTDEDLNDTMSQVERSEGYYYGATPDTNLLLDNLKRAKKLPKSTKDERAVRKTEIRNAKKALSESKKALLEKESAEILINELHKFDTPSFQFRINLSRKLTERQVDALDIKNGEYLSAAMSLPEGTKQERSFKKSEIRRARRIEKMPIKIAKKYPNGIAEPNPKELPQALIMPDGTKEERKAKSRAVKAAERSIKRYHTIANEYVQAQKLLISFENYGKLEEIRQLYKQKLQKVESEAVL